MLSGRAFGCGQCTPCRVNKRRVWTHRILLEANQYADNAFIGLSYSDENLPSDGSLNPKHLQDYFKRLRWKIKPLRLRYFAVGEYGDHTFRPHYHVIAFGIPTCLKGVTAPDRHGYCCEVCQFHTDTWGLGFAFLGDVNAKSAAYCAHYTMKKLNGKEAEQYSGRLPEFSRSSNRPGLGASAMHEVASVLMEHRLDVTLDDVPAALRHGNKVMPLGRYLTRKLRTYIGRDEKTPQSFFEKKDKELQPLREAAFNTAQPGFKNLALREALISEAEPGAIQANFRLQRQRKAKL